MGYFEDILEQLGVTWRTFRRNLWLLGAHLCYLVVSCGQLGVTWTTFWANLGSFGAHLCHLEVTWGHLGVPVDVENRFEYKIEGLECLKTENVEKLFVLKLF